MIESHNGHLSIIPAFVYICVFKIFGYDHYEVFRSLVLIVHLAISFLVADLVRRRHGWVIAAAVGMAVALMGGGSANFLWGFQLGFLSGLLFFLIALHCLQRANNSIGLLWPILTCLSVGLSVASAGTGLGSLAVILILTLCGVNRRRLWWVGVMPTIIYLVWYSQYGGTGAATYALSTIPGSVARYGAATMSGFFVVDQRWGWPMLGIVVVLMLKSLWSHKFDVSSLRFLIFVLVFWLGVSYTRGGFGGYGASRYVYVGAICAILIISDSINTSWLKHSRRTFFVKGCVILSAVLAIWGSNSTMQWRANFERKTSEHILGMLSVVEAHRASVPDETILITLLGPLLSAGDYFEAIDDVDSSPVDGLKDLSNASARIRYSADETMFSFKIASISRSTILPSDCLGVVLDNQPLLVSPGSQLEIHVNRTTGVTMARFSNLNSSRPVATQILQPGSYLISLAADDLGGSLQTKFDDPTAVKTCN
ncbi:unannotated protein [freshwater metagenome]|uniref:Unannotated protein n=1 Tax=freshwater metagenome TaxID=449393 RepID=A0A6J7SW45_9ZZZZ|nr:hypothetical protein [Actinomycetota bacterium]MTB10620.1 hypothetical protein [Actinomycetota bacterium]